MYLLIFLIVGFGDQVPGYEAGTAGELVDVSRGS